MSLAIGFGLGLIVSVIVSHALRPDAPMMIGAGVILAVTVWEAWNEA